MHATWPGRLLAVALTVTMSTALGASTSPTQASSDRSARWAPAASAKIRPGVQMYTSGAQCTGNFVFRDRRDRVYLGYAAHCAGLGAATDTNGCKARSVPLGTRVRFAKGGSLASGGTTVGRGWLTYSSWRTMRRIGTRNANACAYNDFALVRVAGRHVPRVNPTVPFWGGPTGLDTTRSGAGDRVYSYGNSSLRGGATQLSPKAGTSLGSGGGGWTHPVYTATPGIPGDSGSGFMNRRGKALGTLSTLAVAPFPGSNGVGDMRRELRFAQRHSGIPGLVLVRGTRPFDRRL